MKDFEPKASIGMCEDFGKLSILALLEAARREGIHTTQTKKIVEKEIFPSVPLQEKP